MTYLKNDFYIGSLINHLTIIIMSEVTQSKSNGMATASLILGILSIVLGFFGWLGIICGILAIIFSVVAKNKIKADPSMAGSSGQAKTGLITGIIGVVIGLVIIIIAVMFVSAVAGAAMDSGELQDALKELEDISKQH